MKHVLRFLCVVCFSVFATGTGYATDVCGNILVEEFVVGDMLDGNPVGGSNRIREDAFTPVQPSTTYYVQTTKSWHVYFYDADKNYFYGPSISSATESITTPANAYYLKVSSYPSYGTTYQNDLIISPDPITEYVPYNPLCATCSGTITNYESATGTVTQSGTPTPTNPIDPVFYKQGDMVLRKINDTYYDSYDATTGKITRRVGVKVLDGTETFTKYGTNKFAVPLKGSKKQDNQGISFSNFYKGISFNNVPNTSGQCAVFNGSISNSSGTLGINDNRFDSISLFTQWLAEQYSAGTPVTVYYPLAEAIEENVGTSYCATSIKIATTKYTEDAFAGLITTLESAITKVTNIVDTTVQQATEIGNLATTKQDRPDTDCPAGRKCLLIMGADNKPHWYLIQE